MHEITREEYVTKKEMWAEERPLEGMNIFPWWGEKEESLEKRKKPQQKNLLRESFGGSH